MSHTTSSSGQPSATPTDTHEHGWQVESRHATSTGYVLYVRCGVCGTRRVDFQERGDLPPAALSAEVVARGGAREDGVRS